MGLTDRNIYTLPTLPSLGPAGYAFTDPTFGSPAARVTDENTHTIGRSHETPSSSYQNAFSADGTKFYTVENTGSHIIWSLNRTTRAFVKIGEAAFSGEPVTWDSTNPNLLYGPGIFANHHTIVKVDVSTFPFVTTILLDLDTVTAGLTDTYIGALTEGNGVISCIYGGASAEYHHYVLHYPIASPGSLQVLDTLVRNDLNEFGSHFGLHSDQIDKSGRFHGFVRTGTAGIHGQAVAPYLVYIWDALTNLVEPVRTAYGGHESFGYGTRVNNDVLSGTWDAAQWILTPNLAAPNDNRVNLFSPVLTPVQQYAADHSSWNNARSDSMQPVFAEFYRYYTGPYNVPPEITNDVAWRALDGEVFCLATDGSGVVTRFFHHRMQTHPDSAPGAYYFRYTPRVNVDPFGRFFLVTSNWEKNLGTDSGEGVKRRDTFLVDCAPPGVGRARRRGGRFC